MMTPQVTVVIGLFNKAFEEAKRLGVSVRIEPTTTPTPKESYAIDMRLLRFEPKGAANERAVKGEREEKRTTSVTTLGVTTNDS